MLRQPKTIRISPQLPPILPVSAEAAQHGDQASFNDDTRKHGADTLKEPVNVHPAARCAVEPKPP